MKYRAIALAAVAVAGLGLTACEAPADAGSSSSNPGSATKSTVDHSEDVQITSCKKDASTGFPVASVKVTNQSSKSSNYIVTVSFNQGAEQLDTGLATISNLNPGSSGTQEATSFKSDVPSGFTCKVEDTTRMSAIG